ncbi:MAG: nucleoside-diphosphate sugar epimerase/dehydratase [Atribacterota bacterium]|nr:nucleoside-diphosphate sugar epimerase/dehydratase [Atribacterota bacterium]MDD4896819.1 nucleoside-diphosphate sugar epimerase/dehydratase [Atribacterota bacterium]MDD5637982.1 nucleoside-diphosphate sugar epimerase/dehydratase [Atribacterota bacterium]
MDIDKINNKYLWIILDIICINVALLLSLLVRFGNEFQHYFFLYRENIIIIVLIYLFFSTLLRLYDCFWRYLSIKEILLIGITQILTMISSVLIIFFLRRYQFPRTIIFLFFFFCLTFIIGNKLAWRLYHEGRIKLGKGKDRILLVGAGDAGDVISREIIRRKDLGFLVGFVDDDRNKLGKTIHGKRVLGATIDISKIIKENSINSVIISMPSADGKQIKNIVEQIPKVVNIRTLPGLYELVDGKVSYSKIRKLQIEDILGRKPVNLDTNAISGYINNKTLLVSGAGGSIGSEIARQVCYFNPQRLILLDKSENNLYAVFNEIRNNWPALLVVPLLLNITNTEKLKKIFPEIKPDVVFHAASYKHVPILEYYPEEAVWNNIIGTKNLVELSHQNNIESFIMISTDKAINPSSVMGASKRIAEMIVKAYGKKSRTKFASVRFGNVLDSSGSVIPLFRMQISQGGPVTVTDKEVKRYFMTISEASQLVIQAGIFAKNGEVFVLDMGEPIKIYDLAREMIKLMGFEPEKNIKIKVIGLRPGEKLFEELMSVEEKSQMATHTAHKKVFVAQAQDVNKEELLKRIAELEQFALNDSAEDLIKKMQEIIPDYNPNRDKEHLKEFKW